MKLKEYENILSKLKLEKERFLQLVDNLDKKVILGEITQYDSQFKIKSVTQGLSSQEYLQKVDLEITKYSNLIKVEQVKSSTQKNILKVSIILILAFVVLLILAYPEIQKFSDKNIKTYTINVNETFSGTQKYSIDTQESTIIKSLKISGTYSGNVKVYLVSNTTDFSQKYLVFDSQKTSANLSSITGNAISDESKFFIKNVCDETCRISIPIENTYLVIETEDGGVITINNIEYTQPIINHPPKQPKKINDIKTNSSTITLKLSEYFRDEDEDVLHYSSSNIFDAKISINKDVLKIVLDKEGTYTGFVYVTDGQNSINSNIFNIVYDTKLGIQTNTGLKIINGTIDTDELPFVKTGNDTEVESDLTNRTTLNATNIGNRTVNSTVNVTENKITYPKAYAFYIDNKLLDTWNKNPKAAARIIVKHKDRYFTTINDYTGELKDKIVVFKSAGAGSDELEQLIYERAQLQALLDSGTNVDTLNSITGNIIIEEVSERDRILLKIKELDEKIKTAEFEKKVLDSKPVKNIMKFPDGHIEVVEMDKSQLEVLGLNDEIEGVYLDDVVESLMNESFNITQITDAKINTSLTGENIKICVLDTGVNSAIVKNYVSGYDFINNLNSSIDDNGHGTSIANIIYNIAPNSKLYSAKVLDSTGVGYESLVLQGLQYCEYINASIISMSLGSGGYQGYCDDNIVAQKVNELANSTLIIAASGNDGNNLVKVPACSRGALAVGASTKEDTLANFTSYNNATILLAPGNNITTLDLYGNYFEAYGTSLSVPFVSATSALGMEVFNETPANHKIKLIQSGNVLYHSTKTFSRLNALNYLNNKTINNLSESSTSTNGTYGNFTQLADCSTRDGTSQATCENAGPCCVWNSSDSTCSDTSLAGQNPPRWTQNCINPQDVGGYPINCSGQTMIRTDLCKGDDSGLCGYNEGGGTCEGSCENWCIPYTDTGQGYNCSYAPQYTNNTLYCALTYGCSSQTITYASCNGAGTCTSYNTGTTCTGDCNSVCATGSSTCYDTNNGEDPYNICSSGLCNTGFCGAGTACSNYSDATTCSTWKKCYSGTCYPYGPVGSATSWTWTYMIGTPTVISGSETSWTWRTYQPGSGRKVPSGDPINWSWVSE